ncbi:MAG: hypothetical protein IT305_18340 [Chloroflexi bacterium]|nr:hypothetical protein [Chloroflexota bacterium]
MRSHAWRPRWRTLGLLSGLVLTAIAVVGGLPANTQRQASAQAQFVSPQPMPNERFSLFAAAVGSTIYVFGGGGDSGGDSGPGTLAQAYDTIANTWSLRKSLPHARSHGGAALGKDGKIYLVGGYGLEGVCSNTCGLVDAYDPQTDTWEAKPPLPATRTYPAVVAGADGNIYIFGWGAERPGGWVSTTTYRYDPDTEVWTAMAPMPTRRIEFAATLGPDGKISVVGGTENPNLVNVDQQTHERFDPASNTWTTAAPMPAGRSQHGAAFASNGRMYAFGFWGGGRVLDEYDPATNRWARRWLASGARRRFAFVAANDAVYAIGGQDDRLRMTSITLAYSPALDAWLPDSRLPALEGLVVNGGAGITNSTSVALALAPDMTGSSPVEMSFSNDGASWSAWRPFSRRADWTLAAGDGQKVVSARVRNVSGVVSAAVTTKISLDQTPPRGSLTVRDVASVGTAQIGTLALSATDERSGIDGMRLSIRSDLTDAAWRSFATTTPWDFSAGPVVYAQFRDGAGNLSPVYSQTRPSPSPGCDPRPPVVVESRRDGKTLQVQVTVTGPNNGVRGVRFDALANATVDIGERHAQTSPFTISYPAGQEPSAVQFVVRHHVSGPTTVRLTIIDACGEWPTFVGGGPGAF